MTLDEARKVLKLIAKMSHDLGGEYDSEQGVRIATDLFPEFDWKYHPAEWEISVNGERQGHEL